MNIRVGGTRKGTEAETCSTKGCRASLHKKPVYEWTWFIQDSTSALDGETHHVKICTSCYENMQRQFEKHVLSSNEVSAFVAYEGVDALTEEDTQRLDEGYVNDLKQKELAYQ